MSSKPIYILPSASASMVSRYADGYKADAEAGYAAALRDAVEAIKNEWVKSRSEVGDPPLRMQVVDAIEALGGEQDSRLETK